MREIVTQKLMRYLDNLKHEVKSCYNVGVMHNYNYNDFIDL